MKPIIISVFVVLALCVCVNSTAQQKQLNITLLLDLSDRIDPKKHPVAFEHYQRDSAIVKIITEYFKAHMAASKAKNVRSKIRVCVEPAPPDPAINRWLETMDIDCAKNDVNKQNIYDSVSVWYTQYLDSIYRKTMQTGNWEGSDIWGFFDNKKVELCIAKDTAVYRNILIILTDGYIYHKSNKVSNGNHHTFLLPENIAKYRPISNEVALKSQIDTDDFGLQVPLGSNLSKLDILVLEISKEKNDIAHNNDEKILTYVIGKWFDAMKVGKYEIYNTDLPVHTKGRIENFLQ